MKSPLMLALVAAFNLLRASAIEFKDVIHNGNGVLDARMEMLRSDGRDPDQTSVFEEMRLLMEAKKEQTHPVLEKAAHGADVDI